MGKGQGLFAKKVKDGEGKRQQAHKDRLKNKDAAARTWLQENILPHSFNYTR